MKAFVMGMAALAAITVISAIVLDNIDMSAEHVYSSAIGNIRL